MSIMTLRVTRKMWGTRRHINGESALWVRFVGLLGTWHFISELRNKNK